MKLKVIFHPADNADQQIPEDPRTDSGWSFWSQTYSEQNRGTQSQSWGPGAIIGAVIGVITLSFILIFKNR